MTDKLENVMARCDDDDIIFLDSVRGEGKIWVMLTNKQLDKHILQRHQNPELVKNWKMEDGPIPSQFSTPLLRGEIITLIRDGVANCDEVQF